ncbi:MAG: UvrD-helicase domain-containing protein [Eubacterium sp.]|nr:UvrD-helicase domain-containing protein [Eubacterium sp.]
MPENRTTGSGDWPEERKKEYIRTSNDNLFVEAGAGAGKTTLLTRRIVNLIKAGKRPEGFVLITYTEEAAGKLRERIVRCLKEEQILAASDVYQNSNPAVGDREQVLEEVERAVRMAGSMCITTMYGFCRMILREETADPDSGGYSAQLSAVCSEELPPDEILRRADTLVRERGDIRRRLKKRFSQIYVDEFQDADRTQIDLIWRLATEEGEKDRLRDNCLFVVGDSKQSIYWYRGAESYLMDEIQEKMERAENASVLHLVWNFRSDVKVISWVNRKFKKLFPNYWEMKSMMNSDGKGHRKDFDRDGIMAAPDFAGKPAAMIRSFKNKDPRVDWQDFLVITLNEEERDACLLDLSKAGIPAAAKAKEEKHAGHVRVLTVYQVKGLAGNIVVLADHMPKAGTHEPGEQVPEVSRSFEDRRALTKERLTRLEYVAITRARFAAVFLGTAATRGWFTDPVYQIESLPHI